MLEKFFSEFFMGYCNDTQQRPDRELALNLKQLLEKKCTSDKFVLRSQRIGLNTASALARYFSQTVTKDNPLCILDLHENVIRDKGAITIIEELKNLNTLELLDLGSNDLGKDSAVAIANMLKQPGCKLQTLILGSSESEIKTNKIETEGGTAIAEALERNLYLTSLDLNRNYLLGKKSQQAFFALADSFDENKTISCLRLGDTGMGNKAAINIIESLSGSDNLRFLDFQGNGLSADIASALGNLVSSCINLSVLLLQRNNIKQRGAQLLCNGLMNNDSLVVLNLASNKIGDEGAEAVAEYLNEKHTLTYLNLSDNDITDIGALKLVDSLLSSENTLHTLILSDNKIGNNGAKGISKCIEYPCSPLQIIDLSSCGIGDPGGVALFVALTCNSTLATLKLYNNYLSESSGSAAIDLLDKNRTINSIDLKGNQLDHSTFLKIEKILIRNKTEKMLVEPNKLKRELIRLKYAGHLLNEATIKLNRQSERRKEAETRLERINEEISSTKEETKSLVKDFAKQIDDEEDRIRYFQSKIEEKLKEKQIQDKAFKQKFDSLREIQESENLNKEQAEKELEEAKNLLGETIRKKDIELSEAQQTIEEYRKDISKIEKLREKYTKEINETKARIAELEGKVEDSQKIEEVYKVVKEQDEEVFATFTGESLLDLLPKEKKVPKIKMKPQSPSRNSPNRGVIIPPQTNRRAKSSERRTRQFSAASSSRSGESAITSVNILTMGDDE
ncbi:hypothetical protein ABK040_006361 [Willaertia magna]